MFARPSRTSGIVRETLPDVWGGVGRPSQMSEVVGRPSRISRSGRESFPDVRYALPNVR